MAVKYRERGGQYRHDNKGHVQDTFSSPPMLAVDLVLGLLHHLVGNAMIYVWILNFDVKFCSHFDQIIVKLSHDFLRTEEEIVEVKLSLPSHCLGLYQSVFRLGVHV